MIQNLVNIITLLLSAVSSLVRKDRGAGAQEIRGPMGYGTRGWKGWEEGVLKARKKIGEFTRKCLIFRKQKRAKGRKPRKRR